MVAIPDVPSDVDESERHPMESGSAPTATDQHGERHACDDRDADRGAHDRPETEEHADETAAGARRVLGGRQQVCEPEDDRARQRDLEAEQNVCSTGAVERERKCCQCGDRRTHEKASHRQPDHDDNADMRHHGRREIRRIRAKPEHTKEESVDNSGQSYPVAIVSLEQTRRLGELSVDEKHPLVDEEPPFAAAPQEERERRREADEQYDEPAPHMLVIVGTAAES
jgi:hypothetical protein